MAKVKFAATKFYGLMALVTGLFLVLTVNSISGGQFNIIAHISIKLSPTPSVTITPTLNYIVITETPIPTPTKRPTLTPTKTPIPVSAGDLESLMEKYAKKESVDRELLKRIARCESRLNPRAINGPYGGLYQFSAGSWKSVRNAMNENPDPELRFNAEEAIKTAAFKIARGHTGIWPNCK